MIRERKRLFWAEGGKRTDVWKAEKSRVEARILDRKREYLLTQKGHILAEDANRNFYEHVKNFNTIEKPKEFDVRQLLPGKRDFEVAEELAEYFNKVSQEFSPLEPSKIPSTKPCSVPVLMNHEVSKRIKKFENLSQWLGATSSRI